MWLALFALIYFFYIPSLFYAPVWVFSIQFYLNIFVSPVSLPSTVRTSLCFCSVRGPEDSALTWQLLTLWVKDTLKQAMFRPKIHVKIIYMFINFCYASFWSFQFCSMILVILTVNKWSKLHRNRCLLHFLALRCSNNLFPCSFRLYFTTVTGTPQWTSRQWTGLTDWVRPNKSPCTAWSVRAPSRRGSCSAPRRRARSENRAFNFIKHTTKQKMISVFISMIWVTKGRLKKFKSMWCKYVLTGVLKL